jgi:hypothetical protein
VWQIIVTWERTEAGQRKLALVQVILVIFVSMMLGFSAFIDTRYVLAPSYAHIPVALASEVLLLAF